MRSAEKEDGAETETARDFDPVLYVYSIGRARQASSHFLHLLRAKGRSSPLADRIRFQARIARQEMSVGQETQSYGIW